LAHFASTGVSTVGHRVRKKKEKKKKKEKEKREEEREEEEKRSHPVSKCLRYFCF